MWAGGEAGQIYSISPDGSRVDTVAQMGGFCGGIAWTPDDGELFVCNPQHGIVRVTRSGEWSTFANSAGEHRLVCPNFGVFDGDGNYYVTDSGNWKKRNGCVLRFRSDGAGEVIAGPLGYANGLALSADQRTLFVVESDTDVIYRMDLSSSAMEVHARDVGRLPDGIALDCAGNLYASCYASDDIHLITPGGEKKLFAYDRWAILLSRPTNIVFREEWLYVANLGRTTVTRARVSVKGKPLANER